MKNVCKQQNSMCVMLQDMTTACELSHVENQRWQFFFLLFFRLLLHRVCRYCFVWRRQQRRQYDGVKAIQWIKSISIWMAVAVAHPLIISPKCQCRHFQSHLTFCSATATSTLTHSFSLPLSQPKIISIVFAGKPRHCRRPTPNRHSAWILFPPLLFGALVVMLLVLIRLPSAVAVVAAAVNHHADSCFVFFYLVCQTFPALATISQVIHRHSVDVCGILRCVFDGPLVVQHKMLDGWCKCRHVARKQDTTHSNKRIEFTIEWSFLRSAENFSLITLLNIIIQI